MSADESESMHVDEISVADEFELVSMEEADKSRASGSSSDDSSSSDDNYEPEEIKRKTNIASLEDKIKAVNMAELHPKWSLRTLHKRGVTTLLTEKWLLHKWREQIARGGTTADKMTAIEKWTFDRFLESRQRSESVTTKTLQEWAATAALRYKTLDTNFAFTATPKWVNRFKRKYGIRRCRVIKHVLGTNTDSIKTICDAAEIFQQQTSALASSFDPDFVINTDQMSCDYHDNTRAPSNRENPENSAAVGSKVTHSYTVQYSLTLSGKLLPTAYICLQEREDRFGRMIAEKVTKLMNDYKNVYVTCSTTGRITPEKYQLYLDDVLKPYVKTVKFLLILDSSTGQADTKRYNAFVDDDGKPTCTVKVVPPRCALMCQPCDVYFLRQVKKFVVKIQSNPWLLATKRELRGRDDAIKIHSLVHNQLSAPIFNDMLRYAWYASKLSSERRFFLNVNDVCFKDCMLRDRCVGCETSAFICCAWCRKLLCFRCFYDKYHPSVCEENRRRD